MQVDTTIPIVNDGVYSIFLAEEELEFPQQREANVTGQSVLVLLNPQVNYNSSVDPPETEVQILKFPYTI
jgi:hypothetical protein